MSAATEGPSLRMAPGGELSGVLDRLDVHGPVRDALCFLSGRDAEAFALSIGFAAPDALPERIRETVLDRLNRRPL